MAFRRPSTDTMRSVNHDIQDQLFYNSEWDKLLLLFWKNLRLLYNNRFQFFLAIATPGLFCLILVGMRIRTKTEVMPIQQYPLLNLSVYWDNILHLLDQRKRYMEEKLEGFTYSPFVPQKTLGYAPKTNATINIIMGSFNYLSTVDILGYKTCKDLRKAVIRRNLLVGVCFDLNFGPSHKRLYNPEPVNTTVGIYPKYLKFNMIYPFGVRIYRDTFIGAGWHTHSLYLSINRTDQRNRDSPDGGYVGYIREGFAALQNAISLSYLRLIADILQPDFKTPYIAMQRFPSNNYIRDPLLETVDYSLSLMLLVGNLYPVVSVIANIVNEKRTNKCVMKIMGISSYLHFLAWLTESIIRFCIGSLILAIMLKIKWFGGNAILPGTNLFALLIVLTIYDLSSICFAQMVGAFCKRPTNAVLYGMILWFLTYVPYMTCLSHFSDYSNGNFFFILMFHNTAMGYAIEDVMQFEQYGHGLQLKTIFDAELLNNKSPVGFYLALMLAQCLIYTSISLYVEELKPGFYGLPKRWNFLFSYQENSNLLGFGITRQQRILSTESITSVEITTRRATPFIFQIAGESVITVDIQSLTKVYNSQAVVNNVSMQLHDNEITILLGHNGCGKTSLLSMIAGLIPPTTGNITIEGFDIRRDYRYAYSSLGISMGDSVLLNNLTVEDQLRFFAYMKSLHKKSIDKEVEKYLQATKLNEFRKVLIRDLSIGLKQQLAVCCALTGQSRVVLLDEPSSYMDLPARHRIYNLLYNERNNRTILITSNSVEIVDCLADRVLIMSNGELQCDGTPIFIKKMYGQGFRLILTKNPHCNVNEVTAQIRQYIPNISPACTLGNELIYILDEIHLDKCDDITQDLQNNMNYLGIEAVALRSVNMDDIFYKLGALYPSRENRLRLIEIMNGITYYPMEQKNLLFMNIKERTSGWPALLQKFESLYLKRMLYMLKHKFNFLVVLTIPSLFAMLVLGINISESNFEKMPVLDLLLQRYRRSITIIDTRPNIEPHVITNADRYKEMIFWMGLSHKIEETNGNELFADYILNELKKSRTRVDNCHHIGVTFNNDYIIGWFNNYALHSVPLSLTLIHNALLKAINNNDEETGILVSMEPLNNMNNYMDSLLRSAINNANTLALSLAMAMSGVLNYNIFFIVQEMKSGFYRMQRLAGVNFWLYWSVNIIYDLAFAVLMSFMTVTVIAILQQDFETFNQIYYYYFVTLIMAGVCIHAWNYAIAVSYQHRTSALGFALLYQTFGIICFCHFVESHAKGFITQNKNPMAVYCVWLPTYALCSAISTIYHHGQILRACADKHIGVTSKYLEDCKVIPNCCHEYHILSFDKGICLELVALIASSILGWLVILLKQYRNIFRWQPIPRDNYFAQLNDHKRRHNDDVESKFGEETAFMEGFMIQLMHNRDIKEVPLIIDRLGKLCNDVPIVDRFSLILRRAESFCVLGISGCGLTTLMKLISCSTTPTYGRILIYGRDVNLDSLEIHKIMGYVQQKMISKPEYTVKQILEIFCKLHNYPAKRISEICLNLAKVLGLYDCYNKSIFVLSTGTLNRLNFAIAVMGNPEIFVVDEVTNGVDCTGTRCIWNIMKRMQNKGTAILYGALNFEECEFATRVGFMSHGRLCLIGTPWGLDKVYAQYHFLTVKFNRSIMQRTVRTSDGDSNYLYAATINKLTDFIYKNFQNSVLKEQRGNYLLFLIPRSSSTISNTFTTILRNVYSLNIEDFHLSSGNLSVSFLEFWEKESSFIET